MKTWKIRTFFVIMTIFFFIFSFTSCDNSTNSKLTEVTLTYPPFIQASNINFNPVNLPPGITYTLNDIITGSKGNTATGFNGTVDASLYSHGDVPIFTQIFNKDGREVGRLVVGIRVMGGNFATLMDIDGINSLSDQTSFPSVKVKY